MNNMDTKQNVIIRKGFNFESGYLVDEHYSTCSDGSFFEKELERWKELTDNEKAAVSNFAYEMKSKYGGNHAYVLSFQKKTNQKVYVIKT